MAYRDDLAALEARKTAVEAELAEKTRARDEVSRLVDEARYLARAEHAFAGKPDDPNRDARRSRRRRWLALIATLATTSGVIGYRFTRPAPPDPIEAALAKMTTFERAMCDCNTLTYPRSSECAQRVSDDMTKWGAAMQKDMPVPPKMDEQQTKRATEIGERMGLCMQMGIMPPPEPVPEPEPVAAPAPSQCDEVSCVLDNYEPACCSVFKHAPSKASSDLPDAIDRSIISAGIAGVKATVRACGDHSYAKGKVKLHVMVGSHGFVTRISIEVSPDPELGACVAAAVQKAVFAKTQTGGTFSYPFVF